MEPVLQVLSPRGRITIPVEMREALGLGAGDTVTLTLEGDHLRLSRCDSIAERTAGMLKSDGPRRSLEEEREAFEQGLVEDVLRGMTE